MTYQSLAEFVDRRRPVPKDSAVTLIVTSIDLSVVAVISPDNLATSPTYLIYRNKYQSTLYFVRTISHYLHG